MLKNAFKLSDSLTLSVFRTATIGTAIGLDPEIVRGREVL